MRDRETSIHTTQDAEVFAIAGGLSHSLTTSNLYYIYIPGYQVSNLTPHAIYRVV